MNGMCNDSDNHIFLSEILLCTLPPSFRLLSASGCKAGMLPCCYYSSCSYWLFIMLIMFICHISPRTWIRSSLPYLAWHPSLQHPAYPTLRYWSNHKSPLLVVPLTSCKCLWSLIPTPSCYFAAKAATLSWCFLCWSEPWLWRVIQEAAWQVVGHVCIEVNHEECCLSIDTTQILWCYP